MSRTQSIDALFPGAILQCTVLGQYTFSGIEHLQRSTTILDVAYAYDQNGVGSLRATQRSTGKPLNLTINGFPEDHGFHYLRTRFGRTVAPISGFVYAI